MPDNQAKQLPPDNLQLFEYVSQRYDVVVPQGMQPDVMTEPGFWAHHAVKLRPMNEIRARAEDGTWIADLVVLDCSRTWAKIHILAIHRLTTADVSITQASEAEVRAFVDRHEVKFNQGRKWHVVRKADRAVLTEHLNEKEAAQGWLDAHARSTVGAPQAPKQPTPEPVAA